MHILLATDADWIVNEVTAALGGPDTTFTVCRDGRAVPGAIRDRHPDLVILDLQVGSMGGMAITMALRLDESGGTLPHVHIMMLLDRAADVYLAQRSDVDAWLIKPLDALRLKRAALAVADGGTYTEGLPAAPPHARRRRRRRFRRRIGSGRGRTRNRRIGSHAATGCSAAWLARHVRDVEAGGSNPLTPTSSRSRKWPACATPSYAAATLVGPENMIVWRSGSKPTLRYRWLDAGLSGSKQILMRSAPASASRSRPAVST